MLTSRERHLIIKALEVWVRNTPNEPMLGFLGANEFLTPREIVEQVRENSDTGQNVLQLLEHGLRREGIEKVIARLTRLQKD
jgi:hypothetical protein